jgi:hypothetical protein
MKRPLLIRIAKGSITDVKATAIVVTHFQGIEPGGAELAVDDAIGGAITAFTRNKSLAGELGSFFVVPSLTSRLYAQMVVVLGLGTYDIFARRVRQKESEEGGLIRQVGFRLIEGLLGINVTDFSTVLIGGGGGGLNADEAAFLLIQAIGEAISRLDHEGRIHEFTIVEFDEGKIPGILMGYEKAKESLKDKLDLEKKELTVPSEKKEVSKPQNIIYISLRREGEELFFSVFTDKAQVVMEKKTFSSDTIRGLISELRSYGEKKGTSRDSAHIESEIKNSGGALYGLIFPPGIQNYIRRYHVEYSFIISMERSLVYIPWELLYDRDLGIFLGKLSLGRQIIREESFLKGREPYSEDGEINMLIIANPSGDLDAAKKEEEDLKKLIQNHIPNSRLKVDLWSGLWDGKSKQSLGIIKLLYAGKYEIVHYSGHAFYDEFEPHKSGWFLGENDILRAFEFQNLPRPPVMVFANACESGKGSSKDDIKIREELPYGLADAFIQAGVDIYIGTAWRIGDETAKEFATTVYKKLIVYNKDIGHSISGARGELTKGFTSFSDPGWAGYMLYGTPSFRFLLSG